MQYEFIVPGLYKGKVTADDAAAELERIRGKYGVLRPGAVVDESRDPASVLYKVFLWDDVAAAECYRMEQARKLIDSIQVVVVQNKLECRVRAFVNVRNSENEKRAYTPMSVVIHDKDMYNDLLQQAKNEMRTFVNKYSQLEELNALKAEGLKFINGIR